tara:strand:- start:1026 stop:1352 length:327 start_codon:yes stop_codon:yes gene_type:complete
MLKKKKSIYDNAPPDDVFAEVKNTAYQYWFDNFDNTHGYVTGKVERINTIENHDDNYLFILNMFDRTHETNCISKMSKKTKDWIRKSKIAKGYISEPGLDPTAEDTWI